MIWSMYNIQNVFKKRVKLIISGSFFSWNDIIRVSNSFQFSHRLTGLLNYALFFLSFCLLLNLKPANYLTTNWQTSVESASLPQYLGCNTVFDMHLRVTFLRRKTVLTSIKHCAPRISSKMVTIDECIEFALKNIGLWWRYGISRHCDEWKYIIIGRIFRKWNYFNTSFTEDFRK
jgi:hypothetical protein